MIFKLIIFFLTLLIYNALFFNLFDLNRSTIVGQSQKARNEKSSSTFFNLSPYLIQQIDKETKTFLKDDGKYLYLFVKKIS